MLSGHADSHTPALTLPRKDHPPASVRKGMHVHSPQAMDAQRWKKPSGPQGASGGSSSAAGDSDSAAQRSAGSSPARTLHPWGTDCTRLSRQQAAACALLAQRQCPHVRS